MIESVVCVNHGLGTEMHIICHKHYANPACSIIVGFRKLTLTVSKKTSYISYVRLWVEFKTAKKFKYTWH